MQPTKIMNGWMIVMRTLGLWVAHPPLPPTYWEGAWVAREGWGGGAAAGAADAEVTKCTSQPHCTMVRSAAVPSETSPTRSGSWQ